MSLTWDIESIEDYKNVCWIEQDEGMGETNVRLNPVTEVLIWGTISVGMGEITEKNADEFYARIWLCERLFGAFLIKNGKPENLTPQEIRAHIGLRTNVSEETRAKWLRHTVGDSLKAAAGRYHNDAEKVEPTEDQEFAEAAARAEAEQAALAEVGRLVDSDVDTEVESDTGKEAPKANPFIEKA